MEHLKIIHDIKQKNFKPIYILMGEESYYIDLISKNILKYALEEDERDFNQQIFYGREVDVHDLISYARRYPMVSERQLLLVREAQDVKHLEVLTSYLEQATKSTILVLEYRHKTLDKRKNLYKLAYKKGLVFHSKRLYDNQVPAWISAYLQAKKIRIAPRVINIIAESLGNDLCKIANELEKAILGLPKDKRELTAEHVENTIGISKDFNNFELQAALIKKDVKKANQIINYFSSDPKNHAVTMTMITLFNFFSNLMVYIYLPNKHNQKEVATQLGISPYFVNDYIEAAKRYNAWDLIRIISDIRTYDAKCKGVGNVSTVPEELLRELIYKILH